MRYCTVMSNFFLIRLFELKISFQISLSLCYIVHSFIVHRYGRYFGAELRLTAGLSMLSFAVFIAVLFFFFIPSSDSELYRVRVATNISSNMWFIICGSKMDEWELVPPRFPHQFHRTPMFRATNKINYRYCLTITPYGTFYINNIS